MKKRSKGNKRVRKPKVINGDAGQRAIDFIKNLCHSAAEWDGKPFNILPWEEKIIRDIFGTLKPDGTRQYREAYISTGRRNGKTELAAAIGLYCLFADYENTPEVYTNAGDREQASLVYKAAKRMISHSAALKNRSKCLDTTKRIVNYGNSGFLHALSHEAETKHGFNVSCAINDEIHVWPNRDLYDAMKTGVGSRRQPLVLNITTAGWDRESFCHKLYDYAQKVSKGITKDPTFYSAIYELDENDNWKDEKNWYKANPGLGINRSLDEMRSEFNRAIEDLTFENTFKRLYLNMWTSQETRWLALEEWDACGGIVDAEALRGRLCHGGLDLATTTDVAAFVLVFSPEDDGAYILVPFFFVPEEAIEKRSKKDRVPYDLWAKQGFITPTPGNVIDYNFIKQKMREAAEKYNLREVAYDRWGATALVTDMTEEGLTMVPIGMGFASMSGPTKEMEKLILSRRINHGGNPVLRWMFDNVMMKTDPAGNIKPDKEKSKDKIDGIVAMIIGLDRAIRNSNGTSYYEKAGVKIIGPELPQEEPIREEIVVEDERQSIVRRCGRCGTVVPELEYCNHCGARIWENLQTSNQI